MTRKPTLRDKLRIYSKLAVFTFGFWAILGGIPIIAHIGQDSGWWDIMPERFAILSTDDFFDQFYAFLAELLISYAGSDRNALIVAVFTVMASSAILYKPAINEVKKEHNCVLCGADWAVYSTGKIEKLGSSESVSNYKTTETTMLEFGKGQKQRDLLKRRVTKKESYFKLNQCKVCGSVTRGELKRTNEVLSNDVTSASDWRKK